MFLIDTNVISEARRGQRSHHGVRLSMLLHDDGDRVLPFDADAAQIWGRLRVPHPENAIDKQIAAMALLHDLTS